LFSLQFGDGSVTISGIAAKLIERREQPCEIVFVGN